jgi:hypothetical protein
MAWTLPETLTLGGGKSGTYWYRWENGADMGVQIAYARPKPPNLCKLHISNLSMERTPDGGTTYRVTVTNDGLLLAIFQLIGGGVV